MRKLIAASGLSLFLLLWTGQAAAVGASEITGFEWKSKTQVQNVAKVITETVATVLFKVSIKGDAARLRFDVPKKFRDFGIRIDKEIVEAKNKAAESSVIFHVPRGLPLGRHDLVINVIDAADNRELGRVIIPFILLPQGIECMC